MPTFANASPIAPDVVVPFGSEKDGSIYFPKISFNADETIAFVTGTAVEGPLWAWWSQHEVDVMALASLVLFVLLGVSLRRLFQRPRAPGRWYCRRCNYDLGAIVTTDDRGSIPLRCPECGSTEAASKAIAGRTRGWCGGPLTVLILLGIALAGWRMSLGLVAAKKGLEAWPHPSVATLWSAWPVARRRVEFRWVERVRRIDLASGHETGRLLTPPVPGRPTPEGDEWCWLGPGVASGRAIDLMIASFDSASIRRIPLSDGSSRFADHVGFTSDGLEAVIVMHGPEPARTIRGAVTRPPPAIVPIRLLGVHLETHAVREIATSMVHISEMNRTPPTVAAAAEGGRGRWAMFVMSGLDERMLSCSDAEPRRVENPPLMLTGSTRGFSFRIDDGSLIMRRDTSLWGATGMKIDREGVATAITPRFAQADIEHTGRGVLRLLNHGPPRLLDSNTPGWLVHDYGTSGRERWLYTISSNKNNRASVGEIRLWRSESSVDAPLTR